MYKSIKVSEFLHRVKDAVELQPDQEYSLVTIKVHHKGVVLRNQTKGKLIGSKMYRISKGQFILSGIDARNGAFGIVPDELDGAIITNDFWCFDIDETKVKRDFFYWLTNTPLFLNACIKSSQGVTQRIRLQRELFFNFEFRFPPLEEQENFLTKIQHADQGLNLLRCELDNQEKYISQLKRAILQEAISGQLTAEWRKQNPIKKGDPDTDAAALLAKIKAEKQQLIADGKLKKEKPLSEISPDEIPFSLPDSWVWCRLGDICKTLSTGPFGMMLHKSDYEDNGIPVVNPTNIVKGVIFAESKMLVSEKTVQRLSQYKLHQGDIVIARRGNLEKCAVVQNDQHGWLCGTGSFFMRLIIVNNDFFVMAYCSKKSQAYLLKDSIGQTMNNLNQKLLIKMLIPLPPSGEQKAILEKVGYLMKIIDKLEAKSR